MTEKYIVSMTHLQENENKGKVYRISFKGRTAGAIGIFHGINTCIIAENYTDFIEKFYSKFEFYSNLSINGHSIKWHELEENFDSF